jgi:hypothetical protein
MISEEELDAVLARSESGDAPELVKKAPNCRATSILSKFQAVADQGYPKNVCNGYGGASSVRSLGIRRRESSAPILETLPRH